MENKQINMTEEDLKKLARTLKEKKKSKIQKTKQKDNDSFRKLKGIPIIKGPKPIPIIGKFMKEKKFAKRINYPEELIEELNKKEPNKRKIKVLAERIKKEHIQEYKPLKAPILEMVRADGSVEWFEGVKSGMLEITRSDEQSAYIHLRKDKLVTHTIRNFDDTTVQGWLCYENNQDPLPGDDFMDSKSYFTNLQEIMTNRKDVQTERLKQYSNMMWTVGAVIAMLVVIAFVITPWFTGTDALSLAMNAIEGDPAPSGSYTDPGIMIQQQYGLTAEELAIINQVRQEKALIAQQVINSSGDGNT